MHCKVYTIATELETMRVCSGRMLVREADSLWRGFITRPRKLYGGTETTLNTMGMQGRKCHSCELWCKEAKKKYINSNVLMRQKTFIERLYDNRCLNLSPEVIWLACFLRSGRFLECPPISYRYLRIHLKDWPSLISKRTS
ncbi:hypothetical protein TNCV_4392391 [Trichonephila clavipes]|nr:hypothetical protein TNCV_4392391 [Trichonephila clavipes]